MVEIAFLGRPQVLVDGVAVEGDAAQRKRTLLLAILADPPVRPVGRDRLVGYLWPENAEDSARHLLSASLSVLRRALGSEVITTSGDDVGLDASTVGIDVLDFLAAVEAEDWARVIALHRGPFLDGVFISEGNALDSWVEERRRRYQGSLAIALERSAEAASQRGDADRAVSVWKTLASLDPHSGRFALGLMRALVARGDRIGALRQARIHEQLLEVEFEAAPDPRVTAFAEELRRADEGPPSPDTEASGMGDAGRVTGPEPALSTAQSPAQSPAESSAQSPAPPGPGTDRPDSGPAHRTAADFGAGAGEAPHTAPDHEGTTIAVLPFTEPELASPGGYLGDGIAEQILEELGRLEGIRPVSRTSSFAFRDSGGDVREIGRALGADILLEGSVRRSGSRARIWIHLVSSADGYQLWSQSFDRELRDIFQLQDEIGQSVASALQVRLRGPSVTQDPIPLEAWDLYIRGRYEWHQRSIPSLWNALECFRGALEIAPNYAEAWTGIADALSVLGSYVYGELEPEQAFREARAAAKRALVLHPDLPAAHAALAGIQHNFDWDLVAAERSYRRALTLDPANSPARQWYAFLLAVQGRWDEAYGQVRSARQVDPISPLGFTTRAHLLYFQRRFDDALESVGTALRRAPGFRSALLLKAIIRAVSGQPGEALEELTEVGARDGVSGVDGAPVAPTDGAADSTGAPAESTGSPADSTNSPEPVLLSVLAMLEGMSGRTEEAKRSRAALAAAAEARFIPAECHLLAALGAGDLDAAAAAFAEAHAQRSASMNYAAMEPLLDPIRDHPLFQSVMEQIGSHHSAD